MKIVLLVLTIAVLSGCSKTESEWQEGEFVTFRKTLPHECGGQLVFNGTSKPAPYTERGNFFNHVCDKCSATNSVLNATWPQYKQEWRSL
jgi:hypothetical protein